MSTTALLINNRSKHAPADRTNKQEQFLTIGMFLLHKNIFLVLIWDEFHRAVIQQI